MGGLLRFPQHGHVQPSAAQLCLAGRVRIDLQAVVPPQVPDTLPADELARRSARSLAFRTPEASHDPFRLAGALLHRSG